jgi:predicted SAM-dependent methyltransferase
MLKRYKTAYSSLRWAYQPVKHSMLAIREQMAKSHRDRFLSAYLRENGFKGLQIGCGSKRHSGWMNTDLIGTPGIDFALDIEKPLPIPDAALDAIYASEVIEHISRAEAKSFLEEAHRALKPSGVLRLTTPDLEAVCRLYLGIHDRATLDQHETTWLEGEFSPSFWINTTFRNWGHQWLWDFGSLSDLVKASGFKTIDRVEPQVTHSGKPELANLDDRYGMPPPPHCWTSSMIVEATR